MTLDVVLRVLAVAGVLYFVWDELVYRTPSTFALSIYRGASAFACLLVALELAMFHAAILYLVGIVFLALDKVWFHNCSRVHRDI